MFSEKKAAMFVIKRLQCFWKKAVMFWGRHHGLDLDLVNAEPPCFWGSLSIRGEAKKNEGRGGSFSSEKT